MHGLCVKNAGRSASRSVWRRNASEATGRSANALSLRIKHLFTVFLHECALTTI